MAEASQHQVSAKTPQKQVAPTQQPIGPSVTEHAGNQALASLATNAPARRVLFGALRGMGNQAIQRVAQTARGEGAVAKPALVPPQTMAPVIQCTMEDVFEVLGDPADLLEDLKIDELQLREALSVLKFDQMEKAALPKSHVIWMKLTNYFEEQRAPKSPYTKLPYTDPIYKAHRDKVSADLGLETDYGDLGPGARIEKLFEKFIARPFRYTMQAGGFDRFAQKEGDCKTLTKSFALIALQEFGIKVTDGEELRPFFLAKGGATIDPGAYGTSDDGANWFFSNHYWVEYEGTKYDLLFGRKGVETGAFDIQREQGVLTTLTGEKTDLKYYLLTSGLIVWDNPPQKMGPNPTNFRSGDKKALAEQGLKLPTD